MERKDYDQTKIDQLASHFEEIIRLLGDDPSREGLLKTPQRAAKALYYATSGYRLDPSEIMRQAVFTHDGSRMIIVNHILPFFGRMSVGYVPKGNMLGLSKVARVVDAYARRLQVQERLTAQVCREIFETLPAEGAIVSCTAGHLCMKMRGVEKQDAMTTTTDYLGTFATDPALRTEFFNLISQK